MIDARVASWSWAACSPLAPLLADSLYFGDALGNLRGLLPVAVDRLPHGIFEPFVRSLQQGHGNLRSDHGTGDRRHQSDQCDDAAQVSYVQASPPSYYCCGWYLSSSPHHEAYKDAKADPFPDREQLLVPRSSTRLPCKVGGLYRLIVHAEQFPLLFFEESDPFPV